MAFWHIVFNPGGEKELIALKRAIEIGELTGKVVDTTGQDKDDFGVVMSLNSEEDARLVGSLISAYARVAHGLQEGAIQLTEVYPDRR